MGTEIWNPFLDEDEEPDFVPDRVQETAQEMQQRLTEIPDFVPDPPDFEPDPGRLERAVDFAVEAGKETGRQYGEVLRESYLPETVSQTVKGMGLGMTAFFDQTLTQTMDMAQQLLGTGEVDWEAVKAAGQARANLDVYQFEPTDPGAIMALRTIGLLPEMVKMSFDEAADAYIRYSPDEAIDYLGAAHGIDTTDPGKNPAVYAGIKTIGDIGELVAWGKVFGGMGEAAKIKMKGVAEATGTTAADAMMYETTDVGRIRNWSGTGERGPIAMDATLAKNLSRTQAAMERAGGKPLAELARREAYLKGDVVDARGMDEVRVARDLYKKQVGRLFDQAEELAGKPVGKPWTEAARRFRLMYGEQAKKLYSVAPGIVHGIEVDENGDLRMDKGRMMEGFAIAMGLTAAGVGAKIGIESMVKKGVGKGKFLRGTKKLFGKDNVAAMSKVLGKMKTDPIRDQVKNFKEAADWSKEMMYLEPQVVDQLIDLRYSKNKQGFYGNGKMYYSNKAYPCGRNTVDIPGCGREAFCVLNGIAEKGACYYGECYAQRLGKSWGGNDISEGTIYKNLITTEDKILRKEVVAFHEANGGTTKGLAATQKEFPELVIDYNQKYKKLSVKRMIWKGGGAAKVSKNIAPFNRQDIRLGVDTDGAAWLARKDVMDALLEADPRTLSVYSSAYHKVPPPHPLSQRTIIDVTVSGWHPLPETLSRIRWAEQARANGWNVILREVTASELGGEAMGGRKYHTFTKDTVRQYNRVHDGLMETDFFTMNQPLHEGTKHSAPAFELPGCCKGSKKNPFTCDNCEVAEGLGHKFQEFWGIGEEGTPGETVLPDSPYEGRQMPTGQAVVGAAKSAGKLMGEKLKGERGSASPEDLSPDQQAEYHELARNIVAIKRNARRTKKTVQEYLVDLKHDPKVAELLEQEVFRRRKEPRYAGSINLDRQDIPEELKELEVDILKDKERQVVTWAETDAASREFLKETENIERMFAKIRRKEGLTHVELDAARKIAVDDMNQLATILKQKEEAGATYSEQQNAFTEWASERLELLSDASSEQGRGLNILKRYMTVPKMMRRLQDLVKSRQLNPRELAELANLNTGNIAEVSRFMDRLGDPKLKDYFIEYWYNAILSAPPTHIVNIVSNTGWAGFQIPHAMLRAGIDLPWSILRGRQRQYYFSELVPMLAGYKSGFLRGRKSAKQMFRKGELLEFDSKWAIDQGHSVGAWERSPYAPVRAIAPYLTLPSKSLRAMDVWANAIAYDAHVNVMARRASKMKRFKRGVERDKFERNFKENLTRQQHNEAMEAASYSTFMDKPDPITGALINIRERVSEAIPGGGNFVVPFINTISNLTKRGVEMTPGLGIIKEYASRRMGRGHHVADVAAKQIEGAIVGYYIYKKFANGEITGRRPDSRAEMDHWYRMGIKPWSIKFGDTWYSYRRMEPFNTVIASCAIAFEEMKNAKDNHALASEIFLNVVDGIKQNLIDSSYMQGIQNILNKYGGIRRDTFPRWAASWVPASSFFRSMVRSYEVAAEEMGKGESLWDAMLEGEAGVYESKGHEWAKAFTDVIPGLRKYVEVPKKLDLWSGNSTIPGGVFRQWLPYKWVKESTDPIEQELHRLNFYPSRPMRNRTFKHKGVQYGVEEELYREFAINFGHDLKTRIGERMETEAYKARTIDEQKRMLESIRRKSYNKHKRDLMDKMGIR